MFHKILLSGFFVIDKGISVSSNYVGKLIRKLCGTKKTGHIGTLDPLASGILTIAINDATKLIPYVTNEFNTFPEKIIKKIYEFDLTFGEERDTFDSQGKLLNKNEFYPPKNEIEKVIKNFLGEIKQTPPKFSAVKISGIPAYKLARSGKNFETKERLIKIFKLEMTNYKKNIATFIVECSSGTYIRSLAVDIASSLNAIGHVSKLRRIHDGKFGIEKAISFDKIYSECDNENIFSYMYRIESVLDDIPAVFVSESNRNIFLCGGVFSSFGSFFVQDVNFVKDHYEIFSENDSVRFLRKINSNVFFNNQNDLKRIDESDEKKDSLCFVFFNKNLIGLAKLKEGFLFPVRVFNGGVN